MPPLRTRLKRSMVLAMEPRLGPVTLSEPALTLKLRFGRSACSMATVPPSSRAARAELLSKINSGVIPSSRCFFDTKLSSSFRDWSGSSLLSSEALKPRGGSGSYAPTGELGQDLCSLCTASQACLLLCQPVKLSSDIVHAPHVYLRA